MYRQNTISTLQICPVLKSSSLSLKFHRNLRLTQEDTENLWNTNVYPTEILKVYESKVFQRVLQECQHHLSDDDGWDVAVTSFLLGSGFRSLVGFICPRHSQIVSLITQSHPLNSLPLGSRSCPHTSR